MMINNHASDEVVTAAAVARYNIKHFCKRLAEEGDETKRQTIFKLVAEEKAKLDALMDLVDMRPQRLKRMVADKPTTDPQ